VDCTACISLEEVVGHCRDNRPGNYTIINSVYHVLSDQTTSTESHESSDRSTSYKTSTTSLHLVNMTRPKLTYGTLHIFSYIRYYVFILSHEHKVCPEILDIPMGSPSPPIFFERYIIVTFNCEGEEWCGLSTVDDHGRIRHTCMHNTYMSLYDPPIHECLSPPHPVRVLW
jgi:hypothetical protein